MAEWKPIKEIPREDGKVIIGYNKDNDPKIDMFIFIYGDFYEYQCRIWKPDLTHAIEIEIPGKKHICYGYCCACHSADKEAGMVLDVYRNEELVDNFNRIRIKYCPFCGKRNENGWP